MLKKDWELVTFYKLVDMQDEKWDIVKIKKPILQTTLEKLQARKDSLNIQKDWIDTELSEIQDMIDEIGVDTP